MELVIEQDGITLTLESDHELDLTHLQDFLASLQGEAVEEVEDGDWYFDEDEEIWYRWDAELESWVVDE